MDGIVGLSEAIGKEFERLLPSQRKTQRHALSNPLIDPDAVMAPFACDAMGRLADAKEPVVLIMDQSKGSEGNKCVNFRCHLQQNQRVDGEIESVNFLPSPKVNDRHQVLMLALRHGKQARGNDILIGLDARAELWMIARGDDDR